MPPVLGIALASSAMVSAPQMAKTPPATHTASIGSGPGSLSAMPAGLRKIPDPIVVPITTAMALHRPMRPVSVEEPSLDCAVAEVVITRNYGAGLRAGRPDRDISRVPDNLPSLVFWICAAAIVVAQVMILRSTRRAWQFGREGQSEKPAVGFAEWTFAVGPVVALGVLLWATYRAVMP